MRGKILMTVSATALALTTGIVAAQNPNQPQPQLNAKQKLDQPIDHEKERAKQNAGQTKVNGTEYDPNKGRGRTPETGQAMGMPPSPPNSNSQSNALAELPGVSAQTIPAKFSADVAAQDEISTTARGLALTDQQKSLILQRLGETKTASNSPEGLYAEAGTLIPSAMEAQEIPAELQANIPGLKGLKYVKKDEQVLLVMPSNGIVRNVLQ